MTNQRTAATASDRFWAKVRKTEGCWLWTGAKHRDGYGYLWRLGKQVLAHRFAFTDTCGPIPDGLVICHTCDVRPCVRPAHLALGTKAFNNADRKAKGRTVVCPKFGEANGAARLTEAIVRSIRSEHAAGGVMMKTLAEKYGLHRNTISDLIRRKDWPHVT